MDVARKVTGKLAGKKVLLKCFRFESFQDQSNMPRLIDLPCELIELIFRCPQLHQVERVLLGRTCKRFHELQLLVYPFPAHRILSKDVYFASIASFLVMLEKDLPLSAEICGYHSYINAMTTWLLPYGHLIVLGSWALRMIDSELTNYIYILRRSCVRVPTVIFAIFFVLRKLVLSNRQWIDVCTAVMCSTGRRWPSHILYGMIRKPWNNWSADTRDLVIEKARRYRYFELADSLDCYTQRASRGSE
jgi:hypothetical protein